MRLRLGMIMVAAAALAAADPAPVLRSTVVSWAEIESQPATNQGRSRSIVRSRTATLDEIESHVTTLAPGTESHPPHRHPQEEILIVKQGVLDATIEGRTTRVEAGGFVFLASQEEHNVRNVGTTPAVYFVIQWRSPPLGPTTRPSS